MRKMKKCVICLLTIALLVTSFRVPVLAETEAVKMEGFENALNLTKIGAYVSGTSNKDGGVAEIVSYDNVNNKAWVVNGATGMLDILELADVTCNVSDAMPATSLDIKALVTEAKPDFAYGDMTSVSICSEKGLAAVALQDAAFDKNGYVAILTTDGALVTLLEAGCQPDMVTFTPDGAKILVANEGEPRDGIGEGIVDPTGSVTIVTLNDETVADSQAETIGFATFDAQVDALIAAGVIFRKDALPSVDLEPEYIACSNDTAYVALQEANAIAVLDLNSKTYTGVYSLGYKDLSLAENAIDLVEDGEYLPTTYPDAVGAYMPDGVSLYTVNGQTYILTANEGDAREWGLDEAEYVNEIKETIVDVDGNKAKKVRVIDPELTSGLPEGKVVLFGGRSFSIYLVEADGLTQVYDSKNELEAKTSGYFPDFFNCSNDDNEYDSRSPKKGPEAESVTVGTVDDRTYAFVALERIGGIMVYDITNPAEATYENYINTRNFAEDPDDDAVVEAGLTGDIAPEGLYFISAEQSPSGTPILLAAFEVSGTVAAYAVGDAPSGHTPVQTGAKDATCTEEGYTGDTVCAVCGDVLEAGSVVEKLPHNYVEGVCSVCGAQDPDAPQEPVAPEEPSTPEPEFPTQTPEAPEAQAPATQEPETTQEPVATQKPSATVPQTGDTSTIFGIVLMIVSGTGALALALLLGKRKKQE